MSWRNTYRPGSFRGVPFVTQSHDAEIGRRGETHEFPERDGPWREDLGRKARRWAVRAFVIGPDYMDQRDALMEAIEAPGPGTLVHPWLGQFSASVDSCRFTESTAEGGMARFDLSFVEPGAALIVASSDTAQASLDTADATDAAASDRFAGALMVGGQPLFVGAAANQALATLGGTIAATAMTLGGSGAQLQAFQGGLSLLANAGALIGLPATLASTIVAVVGALSGLSTRPEASVAALHGPIAAAALPGLSQATPSRAVIAANTQAIADLVAVAAGGSAARIAARAAFTSYDDAVALRDTIATALDDAATSAADRGNEAMASDLDDLRRAVVADISARGGSLQRLFGYTPATATPAIVIAWRLYHDASSTLAQTSDLIARNRVRHPGFVPPERLQVLTASGVAHG